MPVNYYTNVCAENVAVPRVDLQTNVVQLKAGYVAQVVIGGSIAWETKPKKTAERALEKARAHVVGVFA